LKLDYKQIKLIPAEKENDLHKKGVWYVFNENVGYNFITTKPVLYEDHCKWWEIAFENEYIYIISYKSEICGYIRLTKRRTTSKELNEISIALSKSFQKTGIGSYAYQLFEEELKNLRINQIVAVVNIKNKLGQIFFEKNNFNKTYIRYNKVL